MYIFFKHNEELNPEKKSQSISAPEQKSYRLVSFKDDGIKNINKETQSFMIYCFFQNDWKIRQKVMLDCYKKDTEMF